MPTTFPAMAMASGSILVTPAHFGENIWNFGVETQYSVAKVMKKWNAANEAWHWPKEGSEKIALLANTYDGKRMLAGCGGQDSWGISLSRFVIV